MQFSLSILLSAGVVLADAALLEPYAQCGALTWKNQWQCVSGHTCKPVGTNAFPNYQCLPDSGTVLSVNFPYAQCGGQSFVGSKLCAPGWTCVVQNTFFSTCSADPVPVLEKSPTPELASPGGFCAESASARGMPTECVPGYKCTGPGTFGYYVCLLVDKPVTTTSAVVTTTSAVVTTTSPATTLRTTTKYVTTKTTTTKKGRPTHPPPPHP